MRAAAKVLLVCACVALARPALAGGVGIFDQTGMHFGPALSEEGGTGIWFDQGAGLEILLGRRGERLAGRIRGSWLLLADLQGSARHAGLVSAGMQVELQPALDGALGLYAAGDLGVAPLATHLRVFAFADLGMGMRVRVAAFADLFVEVTGSFRFDRVAAGGPLIFLGARFTLD